MTGYHELLGLAEDKNIRCFLTKQLTFPTHWHDEVELYYVIHGTSKVLINYTEITLTEGQMMIIGSKELHGFIESQDNKGLLLQFNLTLFEDLITKSDISQLLFHYFYTTNIITSDHTHYAGIKNVLENIICITPIKNDLTQLYLRSCIYQFVYELSKCDISPSIAKISVTDIQLLKQVDDYLDQNYQNPITLDTIAAQVNLSKYYFTKHFKALKGVTFGLYLRQYRLKKALYMLIETDHSMIEIAYDCGFNSVKTFNRLFKEYTKVSPTQYKRAIFEKNRATD